MVGPLGRYLLRLDTQVCFPVYAASRLITQAYQPLLTPLGLTYPQYLVMLVLWEQDGLSVQDIGDRLLLDSGTLTPLLKRLRDGGYIRSERSAEDERVVLTYLSDAGRALADRAKHIPARLAFALGAAPHELLRLKGELERLIQRLSALGSESTPPRQEGSNHEKPRPKRTPRPARPR